MEQPAISVVIPYFQRDPGILRRALASVMAQRGVENVNVVVVDDASPVPASAEIASLGGPSRFPVRVIRQPNGGPGAARNTALDGVDPTTRYVAFLDSDDEWTADHLSNAVFALGRGSDVYFADLYQLNQSVSAFKRAGRIKPDDHPTIAGGADGLREFRGNMLVQIVTGNVIGTPTVVYDFNKFADLRFRPEYLNAGEDYLFWMDLAKRGARFSFSIVPEVTCGAGVNVYTGSVWGTRQHFLRIHNEMRYRKVSLREYSLPKDARMHVRKKINELRIQAASSFMHQLRHGTPPEMGLLLAHFRLDPISYFGGIPIAIFKKSRAGRL